MADMTPRAPASRCRGTSSRNSADAFGISAAENTACRQRHTSSTLKSGAILAARLTTPKPAMPSRNTRLRPSLSPTAPAMG
jgi:hypothetical protein